MRRRTVSLRLTLSRTEMKQYRLEHVVLRAGRCGFKEGFLWHQPNGTWGVELGGVAGAT